MPTELYSNNLEFFIEGESLGANNSDVSVWTDTSGNGRDLEGDFSEPIVEVDVGDGKKGVVWDGTKRPLVWAGDPFKLTSGFLVLKINSLSNYDGILTGVTDNPILVGNHGNNQWFNFKYLYKEIRINDRLYRINNVKNEFPPVLQDEYQIVYFNLRSPIWVSSIQFGQDRNFTDRKANMTLRAVALYSHWYMDEGHTRVKGEQATRKVMESFAYQYQIPIADVFPYQGQKADAGAKKALAFSDGQRNPTISVKSDTFWSHDVNFDSRSFEEFDTAETYFDAHAYTSKTFFYRHLKKTFFDRIYRFDTDTEFQDKGSLVGHSYGFSIIESDTLPDYYVPAKPDFTGIPVLDTTPPNPPTNFTGLAFSSTQNNLSWVKSTSTDVVGYRIRRSLTSGFADYEEFFPGDVAAFQDTTGINPGGTYHYKLWAFDGNQNYSAVVTLATPVTTPNEPDNIDPVVVLAPPPSTVSGTVTLNATATDNVAVQRVDFYLSNSAIPPVTVYLGTDLSGVGANYSYEWVTPNHADGVYTPSVIAYDTSGNMSAPHFQPNITIANAVNQIPTLSPIVLTPGDTQITADLVFADSDGTVAKVYLESSPTGANQNSPKGTNGWETVQDGETPDTGTTHQYILTGLAEGETAHFRAWVEDNDGGLSLRRFALSAANPPVSGSGDFVTTDDGDFVMTDSGDFVATD